MAFFNLQTGRVDIPSPLRTLPKNPLRHPSFDGQRTESLGPDDQLSIPDSNVTAFSDVQKIISRDDKVFLRKLIRTDQREFITGTSDASLKATHVLSAIRVDGRHKETKRKLKIMIEEVLTHFWFNNGNAFELDSRPNMILLSANNHAALNTYGLIGLSPGQARLRDIAEQLLRDNADWANRVEGGMDSRRNLDLNAYPYNVDSIEWEVVVFHRDDYLSPGEPSYIVDPRSRTLRGEPVNDEPVNDSVNFCHIPDRPYDDELPLLLDSNDAPLRFKMRTNRKDDEKLSLFAMLVNLHSKLQAYMALTLPQRPSSIRLLYLQVQTVIEYIFFAPPGLNLRAKLDDELPSMQEELLSPVKKTKDKGKGKALDIGNADDDGVEK
ncbi:hypothetical protein F5880DRAFT_1027947 [Lentinula raphanica]|nr:hypothetical protein F5880DRAFT_1027947 [Lentinula raphanica]